MTTTPKKALGTLVLLAIIGQPTKPSQWPDPQANDGIPVPPLAEQLAQEIATRTDELSLCQEQLSMASEELLVLTNRQENVLESAQLEELIRRARSKQEEYRKIYDRQFQLGQEMRALNDKEAELAHEYTYIPQEAKPQHEQKMQAIVAERIAVEKELEEINTKEHQSWLSWMTARDAIGKAPNPGMKIKLAESQVMIHARKIENIRALLAESQRRLAELTTRR